MGLQFRKAAADDLEMLVTSRIEMLKAANPTLPDADFVKAAESCRIYYLKSLEEDIHIAYLAFDGDVFAGCGGVSFYQVLPNCKNPSGMNAYIMNIYTVPGFRGQGIATKIVDLLVKEALLRGIHEISLKATDMGRPVYERYGFQKDEAAMKLKV